jgi:hypothetical protein
MGISAARARVLPQVAFLHELTFARGSRLSAGVVGFGLGSGLAFGATPTVTLDPKLPFAPLHYYKWIDSQY